MLASLSAKDRNGLVDRGAWSDSQGFRTSLVQSLCRPDRGMSAPRRSRERNPAADPELAGPHLREARMFSLLYPELVWVALGFILSMAGMLAAAPE